MGAYFKLQKIDNNVIKTLTKKEQGSKYPTVNEFKSKIDLLQKYLSNNVVDTRIGQYEHYIEIKQPFIKGVDLFIFLKNKQPQDFIGFVKKLRNLYSKTKILPDLLGHGNILVTKEKKIKIVDVWPLFFEERVKNEDLNVVSYEENIKKFKSLENMAGLKEISVKKFT